MNFKTILLIVLLIALGVFGYFKWQVNGDINSRFNQTQRYDLGKNGVVRWFLGLHRAGDARKEYLANQGPIVIEWFKAASLDINEQLLKDFAKKVQDYTGRPTQILRGGGISDGVVNLSDLSGFNLKASSDSGASTIVLFFVEDYKTRPEKVLSDTYGESGILISMKAHRDFVKNYSYNLDNYYLSSLLKEFGHQIGLGDNDENNCVMNPEVGVAGMPYENYGRTVATDYCQTEKNQIDQLRSFYQN